MFSNRQFRDRRRESPGDMFCWRLRSTGIAWSLLLLLFGCRANSETQPPTAGSSEDPATTVLEPRLPKFEPAKPASHHDLRDEDWFDSHSLSDEGVAYRDGQEAKLFSILETVGGGLAFCDFDGDGDYDLIFTGGGEIRVNDQIEIRGLPTRLLRNEGAGNFELVSAEVGLEAHDLYSHGCSVADFDSDGFSDVLVTGFGSVRLYRNQGDGTFRDITAESGLNCDRWQTGATWADVDRDGNLDLFVVTYVDWKPRLGEQCVNTDKIRDVCGPSRYLGQPDYLWHNRGDGRFEDISESSGVALPGRGFSAVAIDVNGDGWQDFFVANDVQENYLFLGDRSGHFQEAGVLWGCAYSSTGHAQGSMGAAATDVNGDGWPDLWVTNFTEEDNALYLNEGGTGFTDSSVAVGLAGVSWKWVGFGTGFADFDHDGWLDLVIANGHVQYSSKGAPYRQPAQLFRNQGGGRFAESSSSGGSYFRDVHPGRGLAIGDFNDDGAADFVVVHQNEPATLLQNRRQTRCWARLLLCGTTSNRDGFGAKVTFNIDGRQTTRWVQSGSGYLSTFDPRVLLALPNNQNVTVNVLWPSGMEEEFPNLTQRQTHVLREGRGIRHQ